MNVLLIGATGFSGQEVLKELLVQKHKVTALTRRSSSFPLQHEALTILEGDVLDENFITQAVQNQDAVINCLGIGGKGNSKPNSLISDVTRILVKSMEKSGVKRLICMSNVGAGSSMQSQPWFFTKIILPFFMRWLKVIIDDKNIMEPLVMKSKLEWTILRFPNIVNKKPKGTITTSLDGGKVKMSITNKDLAGFMVEQLTDKQFIFKAPCVSN